MNKFYDVESHQITERSKNDSIVHEMNELADQGEHHDIFQILYTHEGIIDIQVKFISTSSNGKTFIKTGMIKEKINEYGYYIELSKGMQRFLVYQELINMINKENEECGALDI